MFTANSRQFIEIRGINGELRTVNKELNYESKKRNHN